MKKIIKDNGEGVFNQGEILEGQKSFKKNFTRQQILFFIKNITIYFL